mmetsp:Transcript_6718/g.15340  ORF Transcript_6718/g.15340 Transcript_6718/m.15340 type:complete len:212 (-) Transcript_6718:147-782(-)
MIMILVRRPYDLGDKINIADPMCPMHPGPLNWQVQDLGLYATVIRGTRTHAVATVHNGSIAKMRIINRVKSVNALLEVMVQFDLHTPRSKIAEFKKELERYIDEQPGPWVRLCYFYCQTVNIELGYKEFSAFVMNVKPWQNALPCATDRGELTQWCFEKTREMGIHHKGCMYRVAVDDKKKFVDPTYEQEMVPEAPSSVPEPTPPAPSSSS